MYGNFEVHSSFSIRQRIDYLNAHKATHPLTADMDIVGGFHIVKQLVLCKLRADTVGRHRLLRVIIAPSCVGFIDRLGADVYKRQASARRTTPEDGIPQVRQSPSVAGRFLPVPIVLLEYSESLHPAHFR